MTTAAVLLAALAVAFPRAGAKLPPVARCYMLGSVEPGVTNVTVQGRPVAVHPMGGWVTMVDCVPGENAIAVTSVREGVCRTTNAVFSVEKPTPVPLEKSQAAPKVKTYAKLAFAGDEPVTNRTRVIVLDAGHGGGDTGAIAPHGLPEKDANLRMTKAVRTALEQRGWTVLMTREDDVACPLYDRPKLAHANKAEAFVSIHHNAPPLDKDPREFRYHAVYAWNAIGEELAGAVNARMAEAFGTALKNNGVPHANFAVTRNPEIPSCLIEVDFISTPEGELDCWNPARRRRVAEAIAAGIEDWAARRR